MTFNWKLKNSERMLREIIIIIESAEGQVWWHTSLIPTMQEAEVIGSQSEAGPEQK
jgi:hypothetical protein